jgi:hypothetical protein
MEEGHGAVGHVVTLEAVGLGGDDGDGGQPTLGAADRLGRARGPRGEEQQEEVLRGRAGSSHQGPGIGTQVGLQHRRVLRGVDQDELSGSQGEVETLEERQSGAVGDQQPTVGAADVLGQGLAPACRVDPHHHRPGQGGSTQPEEVLGDVGEEDPDVQGPAVGLQPDP